MATLDLTAADVQLRDAVIRHLDWDPDVNDSAIGVIAGNGVVTLTGYIDTYAGKLAAERAAKSVRGVRAVANELVVRLAADRSDADIAADAAIALRLAPGLPDDLKVTVHHGHLTLSGRADWLLQRQQAEAVVRRIRGVRGVHDRIEVRPNTVPRDVRRRIVRALHRTADLDARQLSVTVQGDTVLLSGRVGSWAQRDAAERAAGSAPGIRQVRSDIAVEPPEPYAPHEPDCPDDHF